MDWTELSIMTTSEAVEAVANILMAYGATGVSIEDAKDFAREKLGKDTLIVPVLNVFGTGGMMQEKLPDISPVH